MNKLITAAASIAAITLGVVNDSLETRVENLESLAVSHFCGMIALFDDEQINRIVESEETDMILYLLGSGAPFLQTLFAERMLRGAPRIVLPGDEN